MCFLYFLRKRQILSYLPANPSGTKIPGFYSTHHRDTHVTMTPYDVEVICLIIDRTQSRHFNHFLPLFSFGKSLHQRNLEYLEINKY